MKFSTTKKKKALLVALLAGAIYQSLGSFNIAQAAVETPDKLAQELEVRINACLFNHEDGRTWEEHIAELVTFIKEHAHVLGDANSIKQVIVILLIVQKEKNPISIGLKLQKILMYLPNKVRDLFKRTPTMQLVSGLKGRLNVAPAA